MQKRELTENLTWDSIPFVYKGKLIQADSHAQRHHWKLQR